jgi:serine/threonine-protein kinase RsbW
MLATGPHHTIPCCCQAWGRPKRRMFPGRPDQVRQARRFVARALDGCPVADDAILCTSELAVNTLHHTKTATGGTFEVIIWRAQRAVRIAVVDNGSDTMPAALPLLTHETSGRGLALVQSLATRWGSTGNPDRRTVYFTMEWP